MTSQQLSEDFAALPAQAQRQVADFVSFLRQKYTPTTPAPATDVQIQDNEFIGMWSDRKELADSEGWVRELRDKEWSG